MIAVASQVGGRLLFLRSLTSGPNVFFEKRLQAIDFVGSFFSTYRYLGPGTEIYFVQRLSPPPLRFSAVGRSPCSSKKPGYASGCPVSYPSNSCAFLCFSGYRFFCKNFRFKNRFVMQVLMQFMKLPVSFLVSCFNIELTLGCNLLTELKLVPLRFVCLLRLVACSGFVCLLVS